MCRVREIKGGERGCHDFPLRKQLMQVEPVTLCLLRAAGMGPVLLEDKGEREGLKRDCLAGRKMYSVSYAMCPLKPGELCGCVRKAGIVTDKLGTEIFTVAC